jgi:hypothetical protein
VAAVQVAPTGDQLYVSGGDYFTVFSFDRNAKTLSVFQNITQVSLNATGLPGTIFTSDWFISGDRLDAST